MEVTVHLISSESSESEEMVIKEFAEYLVDKKLLCAPGEFIRIIAKNHINTYNMVTIKLGGVDGEEKKLRGYLIYYPDMPPNIGLVQDEERIERNVKLAPDWFFVEQKLTIGTVLY